MEEFKNMIGRKFGDWIIIGIGKNKSISNGKNRPKILSKTWKCECKCGYCNNIVRDVLEKNLLNSKSKGCGLKHKLENKFCKKYNTYNLTQEYGIGYTDKNEEFYFDLEDYDRIKNYYWYFHADTNNNYIRAYSHTENNIHKCIFLHNLIFNNFNSDLVVDHINGRTYDNRKNNLRICKQIKNTKNLKLFENNKSGTKGVCYAKNECKWKAYIYCDGEKIHLGTFIDKKDAIKIRKEAEIKYFGEYNREERYL